MPYRPKALTVLLSLIVLGLAAASAQITRRQDASELKRQSVKKPAAANADTSAVPNPATFSAAAEGTNGISSEGTVVGFSCGTVGCQTSTGTAVGTLSASASGNSGCDVAGCARAIAGGVVNYYFAVNGPPNVTVTMDITGLATTNASGPPAQGLTYADAYINYPGGQAIACSSTTPGNCGPTPSTAPLNATFQVSTGTVAGVSVEGTGSALGGTFQAEADPIVTIDPSSLAQYPTLQLVFSSNIAPMFSTLHSFDGTDGGNLDSGLIQATNGDFYGTTAGFGANSDGTVFRMTPSHKLTTLHSFDQTDGAIPEAGLIQATNGALYGTTNAGGANGDGTIFKITAAGSLSVLHSFDGTDGSDPNAGLIQAANGTLYGTTNDGGANGYGTVFKTTPTGKLTTLHSFNSTDGSFPTAGLVQGTDGNFYGTTTAGGANGGNGTVFKITPGGALTTVYSFCAQSGCSDGAYPSAGLIQATDGDFYGTTNLGGASNLGTIFKITTGGVLTTLHSFEGTDGASPTAGGLIQGTDGAFYGTTAAGGANGGNGTVFRIAPSGGLTTLYSFCNQSGCTDGADPEARLIQATDGTFYGTTFAGGTNGVGTVFNLSVGIGPFVETLTTSGKVGAAVKILGSDLTGATAVSFNGTAATITSVSATEIVTKVPTGATTGPILVTTPGGTLISNKSFTVTP